MDECKRQAEKEVKGTVEENMIQKNKKLEDSNNGEKGIITLQS